MNTHFVRVGYWYEELDETGEHGYSKYREFGTYLSLADASRVIDQIDEVYNKTASLPDWIPDVEWEGCEIYAEDTEGNHYVYEPDGFWKLIDTAEPKEQS